MKELKIRRRLFSLLMAVILCFTMMPMMAFAEETDTETSETVEEESTTDPSKVLTVGSGQKYTTVQQAINAIYGEDDPTEWTIEIESGDYLQFAIPKELDGLTVKAADGATVTIQTWTGKYDQELTAEYNSTKSSNSYYNTQGYQYVFNSVYVQAEDVTFSGLDFTLGTYMPTEGQYWYRACITDLGGYANGNTMSTGMTVTNCTFSSATQGYVTTYPTGSTYNAYGILIGASTSWTVTGCTFGEFSSAISFMCDGYAVSSDGITVTDNTFTSCDRAMDGYYGGTPEETAGTITFSENNVIGSAELRSKIVVMDQTSKGSIGAVVISNNELSYAMVLIENMAESPCTVNDVLADNTFDDNSYYVEGDGWYYGDEYHGSITVNLPDAAYYESPEDSVGYWVLNVDLDDLGSNTDGATTYVQNLINAANREGSHVLSITWSDTDEKTLIETVTKFKDCIYWVAGENGKASYPGLEKKILVTDKDGVTTEKDYTSVSVGDDVKFQLTSNVPTDLTNYLVAKNAEDPDAEEDGVVSDESGISLMSLDNLDGYDSDVNGGSYILTFHDEMDSALTFNDDVTVTLVVYELDDNGDIIYETDEDGNYGPKIKETVILDAAYYNVLTGEGTEDDCTFHVTMDLVELYNAGYFTEDDFGTVDIIVTYTATVETNIKAGDHLNTSAVEYEGNSTEEDTVVVYTYGIKIFKFDQSSGEIALVEVDDYETNDDGEVVSVVINEVNYPVAIATDGSMTIEIDGTICEIYIETDENGTVKSCYYADNVTGEVLTGLAGAEFVLYREATAEELKDKSKKTTITITVVDSEGQATEKEITCVPVATLTSGENGYALYEGLAAGTYYLVETEAPYGYVKSDTPLTVTILEGKKDENKYILNTSFANSPIPSTGGAGTRMYLIGGVCIMLAAGVMLILSRRRKDFEQ